jgi:hypothetical protein
MLQLVDSETQSSQVEVAQGRSQATPPPITPSTQNPTA